MTTYHNLKHIRTLLTEGFTQDELRDDLCFYESDFRPFYDRLPQGASKVEIIQRLVDYADRRLLLDTLLAWAKEYNPARYDKHQPYYEVITGSTVSSDTYKNSPRIPQKATEPDYEKYQSSYEPNTSSVATHSLPRKPRRTTQKPLDTFTGRQEELKQLHKMLDKAVGDHCQIVFLAGEAGIGKTTLMERFLQEAHQRIPKLLTAHGRCTSESELSGLSPFIQVLSDLYDVDSENNQQDFGGNPLKPSFAFLAEVAPAWFDIVTGEGQKQQASQSSGFSQRNVFEQFTNLLIQKAKEDPIIIFLDDLQWIDLSSLDLLFYLSRNLEGCPILIITAYRSSSIANKKSNFLGIKNDIIGFGGVELPELKHGIDIVKYAAQRFPNHDFSPDLLKAIHERTEGYPLFVQQIFNWLQEQGNIEAKLDPNNGEVIGWHLINPVVVLDHIPQSVQAVIANRVERLEEKFREILNYASVEGEDFTVQVVAQLLKMDEIDLLDRLEVLEQQYRLIKEVGEKSLSLDKIISLYRFSHRLIRNYLLYEKMGEAKRRMLHLRVAECLETLYQRQPSLISGQLANHFRLAQRLDKSCYYSLLATQTAYNGYGWTEAISWAKIVLELLMQPVETHIDPLIYKAEAIIVWEKCTERLGDGFEEVISELEAIIEALNQKDNYKELLARSLIALGWAYYYGHGPSKEVETISRQAEKVAEESGDLINIYEAKYLLAQTLADDSGKYQEALKILSEQLEIAKKLTDINRQADSLAILAWCYILLGRYEEAIASGTESVHMLENYGEHDPPVLGFTLRGLGLAFQGNGNYDLALQMQGKSSAVYDRLKDTVQLNWCRTETAETLCTVRMFDEALSLLREVTLFAENTNDSPLTCWSYMDLADLNLEKGDLSATEENLKKASQALETYGSKADKIRLNTLFAILYRERKEYQQTKEYVEDTLSLLANVESDLPALIVYDVYGTALQVKGDLIQAEELYQKSIKLSEQLNARVWMATTYQHLGSLYQLQEEVDKARDFYQCALQIRQELQHHWIVDEIQQSLNLLTKGNE